MKRIPLLLVGLVTLLLVPGPADAQDAGAALARITAGDGLSSGPLSIAPSLELQATGFASPPSTLSGGGTTLESVRWRPRERRGRDYRDRRDSGGSSGFTQLHAGFYDPDGEQETGFVGGFRVGAALESKIQLGVNMDWMYKSDRETDIVSRGPLPGGGTSERRLELARSSSNLFPIMAFAQVSPGSAGDVRPYFGFGAGYEVLFLSAEDFTTGEEFDATYGGWGWQGWAGLAIPLSGTSGINAEIFRNSADVERDVTDSSGSYRELVDVDSVGMRFGLSWGF